MFKCLFMKKYNAGRIFHYSNTYSLNLIFELIYRFIIRIDNIHMLHSMYIIIEMQMCI